MAAGGGVLKVLDKILETISLQDDFDDGYEEDGVEGAPEEDGEDFPESDEPEEKVSKKKETKRGSRFGLNRKNKRTRAVEPEEIEETDPLEGYDDILDDGDVYQDPIPETPRNTGYTSKKNTAQTGTTSANPSPSKVTPINGRKRTSYAQDGVRMALVHPTDFEASETIGTYVKQDVIVSVNLEGLDFALAQRIVDFCSGLTYARDANLSRSAEYVYVITPWNVEVIQPNNNDGSANVTDPLDSEY